MQSDIIIQSIMMHINLHMILARTEKYDQDICRISKLLSDPQEHTRPSICVDAVDAWKHLQSRLDLERLLLCWSIMDNFDDRSQLLVSDTVGYPILGFTVFRCYRIVFNFPSIYLT